jgi:hypothetical protein
MKDKIKDTTAEVGKLLKSLPEEMQFGLKFQQGSEQLDSILNKFGSSAKGIGASFGGLFSSLVKNADLGVIAISDKLRNVANPLAETGVIINQLPGFSELNEALSRLTKTQTTAREAFIRTGKSIEEADKYAREYPQNLRRMSVATGLSTTSLNDMNKSLKFLGPDAITPVIKGLSDITGTIEEGLTPMSTFTTVARGLGFSTVESANMADEAFAKFGQSPLDAARSLGVMAEAANQAGVRQDVASKAIVESSSSLGIFGQKSDAAAGVWTTFMRTLKDNVPLSQANSMVRSLTDGLANMRISERSFMAAMSGVMPGMTALGGGLKMELAMRTPGGLEKNMQALTDTLAKFGGGQIITIEQAAENPQMQAQFQIQRQMLAQFTGISDQQQQNRILEVLQGVQTGGISQVEGSKTLQDAFKGGLTIQQKELTALERIEKVLIAGFGGKLDERLNKINETSETYKGASNRLLEFGTTTTPGMEAENERFGGIFGNFLNNSRNVLDKLTDETAMSRSSYRGVPRAMETAVAGARGDYEARIPQQITLAPAALPARYDTPYPKNVNREMETLSSEMLASRTEPIPNIFNQAAKGVTGGSGNQVGVEDTGEYTIQVKLSGDRSLSREQIKQVKNTIKDALMDYGKTSSGTSVRAPHNGA